MYCMLKLGVCVCVCVGGGGGGRCTEMELCETTGSPVCLYEGVCVCVLGAGVSFRES